MTVDSIPPPWDPHSEATIGGVLYGTLLRRGRQVCGTRRADVASGVCERVTDYALKCYPSLSL